MIWNEFLFGVTLTQKPNVQPLLVAVYNLAASYSVQQNVQMADTLLAALPTLIMYILLGRYFLRGLLAGSLKGEGRLAIPLFSRPQRNRKRYHPTPDYAPALVRDYTTADY